MGLGFLTHTLSPVSVGGRLLCNLRLADDTGLLRGSKENSNNSLKDWRKQLLDIAWNSSATKAKFTSTASSQGHLPTYNGLMQTLWKKWASIGSIQTTHRTSTKESKGQIGASTLSYGKASHTTEKQIQQFTYND